MPAWRHVAEMCKCAWCACLLLVRLLWPVVWSNCASWVLPNSPSTAPEAGHPTGTIPHPATLSCHHLPQIQQWLLSAKSPQIAAALGQAAQTQPSPNQPPKPAAKQQQGKQAGQQQPAAQQQAAIKQEQQQQSAGKPPAAKPPAGKPPAPPSKQPSPGPQAVVPQRARPRKPSPLGPLGSKPAAPATATPGGPAAGGAGSTHVTPAGAGIKPAASSEEADGGGEATGIEVEVVCNGLKGTFLVDQQLMVSEAFGWRVFRAVCCVCYCALFAVG